MSRSIRHPSIVVAGHMRRSAERSESQRAVASSGLAHRMTAPTPPDASPVRTPGRKNSTGKSRKRALDDLKHKADRSIWNGHTSDEDVEEPDFKRIKREASASDVSRPVTPSKAADTECWFEETFTATNHKTKHRTSYNGETSNDTSDQPPSYAEAQHSAVFATDGLSDDSEMIELQREAELIDRRLEILKEQRRRRRGV